MITGIVAKHIARTNRNLLLFNLGLLAALLATAFFSRTYLANVFAGPKPMSLDDIIAIDDPASVARYWVHVKIDPENNLGYIGYRPAGKNETMTYYCFYETPRGILIITNSSHIELPGEFDAVIDGHSSIIDRYVIPEALTKNRGHFDYLPVVLKMDNLRIGAYVGIPLWSLVLALCLWNLYKAVSRIAIQSRHPLSLALARFGPPEEIAVAVDAEMQASAQRAGKVITTTSWLLHPRFFETKLIFLGDVVWAYMKEIKHKSNGVTYRTSYATVVCDRQGNKLTFPMKLEQVRQLLADIQRAVPWAYIAFDSGLAALWSKNKRPQFFQRIDQRKQEYEARQSAPPPEA